MKSIRGVALASALVACVSGDDVTRQSSAVSGGSADTTDSAVVTLFVLQNSQVIGTCGAVIVSPHVAVTAAHCINTSGNTYQVAFGNDYTAPTSTIDVTEAHYDSAFDGNAQNGHDLGVVILSSAATVTPVTMNTTALTNAGGKPIRFVGFGVTKTNANNSQRQQTTSSVTSVDANNIYVTDSAHNVCSGDAGGAAFMTFGTTEMLAGVMAQGDAQCANNSISTRVDAEASFIQSYIAQTGTACTQNVTCASDHCVDGVCCDTACTGQCQACDVTGHVGTCTPVTGAPHGSRAACGTSAACGFCDGTNVTSCKYPDPTTVCASSCSGGTETDVLCNGKGDCSGGGSHSCNNFACKADGTQCNTTCTTRSDCSADATCANGVCVSGGTCIDDHTLQPASGPNQDCGSYKCENGACTTTCGSVADCVAPNVCDTSGHCIPPPPGGGGGCSVATSSGGSPWGTAILTVAIASLVARIRRRRHAV